ncbi:hypothetical protein [Streptomyces sp. GESEQ-35]|uniref:hypothetical protein n=1 Tax=Streptomyces sp. GESEQ-35 TaxID=2812657 RepID=UPI001FF46EDC|nr:hypothetical protein [Streptomyces sp. GESEQ-35]
MTHRVYVHQHIVPPFYRDLLAKAGSAEAGGRALPDWKPEAALGVRPKPPPGPAAQ